MRAIYGFMAVFPNGALCVGSAAISNLNQVPTDVCATTSSCAKAPQDFQKTARSLMQRAMLDSRSQDIGVEEKEEEENVARRADDRAILHHDGNEKFEGAKYAISTSTPAPTPAPMCIYNGPAGNVSGRVGNGYAGIV